MVDLQSVTIDIKWCRLLPVTGVHGDVIHSCSLPAIQPLNGGIQQHPVVQPILPLEKQIQFFFQLVHFAGCQKAGAAQIDAKNRLMPFQSGAGCVQNGPIAAYGQHHIPAGIPIPCCQMRQLQQFRGRLRQKHLRTCIQ